MQIPHPQINRSAQVFIKKIVKILFMVVIISLPIFLISRLFTSKKPVDTTQAQNNLDTQVLGAQATVPVNYEFTYFLDPKKKDDPEAAKLIFAVTEADKRDEILVKGKKATAVDGRTFLIINVKVTNPNKSGVEINTRDFFRLSSNGNQNEWLAPDIHNDPVEVQAISTKYTRLGFPINDADTNLVLQAGQINGDKQQIPLNF
jgi:hypothetical protein